MSVYDLTPNTLYTCKVAASTAVGLGPYTDDISATTEGIYIICTITTKLKEFIHTTVRVLSGDFILGGKHGCLG